MYKDKDKQREANRQASQRQRDKKSMTDDCAKAGIVIPDHPVPVIPAEPEVMVEIDNDGNIIPISQPKRGKDIKCFADLPPDVQETIDKMSLVNGKIDQTDKAKRTAAAIKYQHLFPDSYEPQDAVCTGVVTGKPGDADYNGICTPEWRAERGR